MAPTEDETEGRRERDEGQESAEGRRGGASEKFRDAGACVRVRNESAWMMRMCLLFCAGSRHAEKAMPRPAGNRSLQIDVEEPRLAGPHVRALALHFFFFWCEAQLCSAHLPFFHWHPACFLHFHFFV